MSTRKVTIDRTKRGLPALWEAGGGKTSTGQATIVAGPNGEPLKPIYIRRGGHLSCSEHALFVIRPNYIVVEAAHRRKDFSVHVWRIVRIDSDYAVLELLDSYSRGEWDGDKHERYTAAIKAAKDKATCYHCRTPHYMTE